MRHVPEAAGDCGISRSAVTIRWHGQACVTFISPGGTTVLLDPFDPSIGYPLPDVEPAVVAVTHDHYDHSNVQGVRGRPLVLKGLDANGQWAAIDQTVGDVRIRTVGTYHDEVRGAMRGANSLVCLELGGLRAVHCGDLGHVLSADQVRQVGPVDVLMVPVGGVYTIGAEAAREVVRQLAPRQMVIPIHYKTDMVTIALEPVDPFLRGWRKVRRVETNQITLPLDAPHEGADLEVLVLHPRAQPPSGQ